MKLVMRPQHLRQQQKSNPLIIVPDNKFGQRMAQTFADEWQRSGVEPSYNKLSALLIV